MRLLKESGCFQVQIGVESGNDYIRRDILNRAVSREQIIKCFELCKRYGITTYAYNMLGMPFEDKDKIIDTIKLNAEISPAKMHTSIYYPYPKTKLYDICKNSGFITDKRIDSYFMDTSLNFDKSLRDFIIVIQRFFYPIVKTYVFFREFPNGLNFIFEKLFTRIIKLNMFIWGVNALRISYIYVRNRFIKNKRNDQSRIIFSQNARIK